MEISLKAKEMVMGPTPTRMVANISENGKTIREMERVQSVVNRAISIICITTVGISRMTSAMA